MRREMRRVLLSKTALSSFGSYRRSAMKIVKAVADPTYSPPLEKKGRTFKHPLLVVKEGIIGEVESALSLR